MSLHEPFNVDRDLVPLASLRSAPPSSQRPADSVAKSARSLYMHLAEPEDAQVLIWDIIVADVLAICWFVVQPLIFHLRQDGRLLFASRHT
ncbi:hypothetical protein KIV56_17255 [Cryobacterium breve]|uniref:Uncharacterized protein n=1 Tax=Cryobacterium breve TaxID=1259258 RepID=A0ABY7NGI1_9MICO|nr:hypothetical protein [Cryobacterium breve]WBM81646.1 hypothetical protein KIV56_17255 [Cryobacterium breve]